MNRSEIFQLLFGSLLPKIHARDSFALNRLDQKLEPYLQLSRGFFVESGANDGVNQSNSLYFEKYLGWKGLLIEAIPSLAKECKRNRPKCIVENCALVSDDYLLDTVEMHYCNLMSIVKGARGSSKRDRSYLRKGAQFLKQDEKISTIEVPARPLSWVLDKHGIGHIDLLSLDVEGYEVQVLKGLDIDRHQPKFMLIEVRNREEIEAIIGHLYEPIAALSINKTYSDMLYRRM